MNRFCHNQNHAPLFAALLLLIASTTWGQTPTTLDAGSAALKSGHYEAAEAIYRNALAQNPDSAEILSNLGISLQMQGKSSEAIRAFEQALRQKQMPRTYALLAAEECKTRDLESARPMLARIIRTYSHDPSVLAVVAPCYLDIDEPIESVQAYTSLLSDPAYPADLALIQLARSYRKAAQFFFGLLSHAPNNDIYVNAIRKARDNGSQNARGAFVAASKASPNFQANLDFSDAVSRWQEHPHDTALLYLLSVLSGEQSMREIEICGEKYPDSPYLTQLEAEMLAHQGHQEEAVALYEKLLQSHPDLPDLLFDLGMLYRGERDWNKALDVFQKQLALHPDDERTAARISEAMIQMERWKELSTFLTPWIDRRHPPLWAMLDIAQAWRNLDIPERETAVLVSAEQLYPSNQSIHLRLMHLYRSVGNTKKAEKELHLFQSLSK